jgi:hypothetical protein
MKWFFGLINPTHLVENERISNSDALSFPSFFAVMHILYIRRELTFFER